MTGEPFTFAVEIIDREGVTFLGRGILYFCGSSIWLCLYTEDEAGERTPCFNGPVEKFLEETTLETKDLDGAQINAFIPEGFLSR
ncbi:hypothetical protein COY23_03060 [bacterium (Candidatus Torokbacteria) CG_4_10_14_0_2_um_filter_35_8]|nr:MAG: hypothetical protein COY23_03060 [bacterium (Candidatus Torokbacteria) CG_4_10_14_0_2_um_filter_35_8]